MYNFVYDTKLYMQDSDRKWARTLHEVKTLTIIHNSYEKKYYFYIYRHTRMQVGSNYEYITHPLTNQAFHISSNEGLHIMKHFVTTMKQNQTGGARIDFRHLTHSDVQLYLRESDKKLFESEPSAVMDELITLLINQSSAIKEESKKYTDFLWAD